MKFLSRMRLIYQISLIGLSALTIFVIVGSVLFVADAQRQSAENSADSALQDRLLVDNIAKEFLNARRREKDFLLRLDEKYVTDHSETVAAVHDGLEQLSANPKLAPFEAEIGAILTSFDAYADEFSKIVNLQRDIGLTEEGGLLGSLRSSVHDVEEALATYNADKLTVIMLMMRRHEKDFLARIDPKYVDRIDSRLAEFGPALAATSSIPDDEKKKITGLMTSYVTDFKALAEKILMREQELGLLSDYYAQAEPVLEQLSIDITAINEMLTAQANDIAERSLMVTVIMFVVGAIALIAMSWLLARAIAGAIGGLTNKMARLAENDFDVDINEVQRADEIGSMGRAVLVFRENGIERKKLEAIQAEADRKRRIRMETQEKYIREFDEAVVSVMAEVGVAVQQLHSASNVLRSSADVAATQSIAVSSGTEEASSKDRKSVV